MAPALVGVVTLFAACTAHHSTPAGREPRSSTTSPTTIADHEPASTITLPPATTRPPATDGSYSVGVTTLDVIEPGNPLGSPDRTLNTTVWYPAIDTNQGLAPDRVTAPYPLIVFSQGFDSAVSDYRVLLQDWASAGFVVAAPVYPHTDPSDPAALDEADILNHPADLRFVITTLLDDAGQSGAVISGLVNAGEIGVVGHSDGGDVSLAVADDSCCRDGRVKAVTTLSGAEFSAFGGTYFTPAYTPLLVVQGNADPVNAPACGAEEFDSAPTPKYYLDLLGASHKSPYVDPGTDQSVVARVVTDFFESTLLGQDAAAHALVSDGNVSGATQLSEGPEAPQPPGACPTAPG